jgi:cytochrome c peroxidase
MKALGLFAGIFWLALAGCARNDKEQSYEIARVPEGFPLPDTIRHLTADAKAQALLGKRLFFDPVLSSSGNFSCASCHIPQLAFSGATDRNVGENGGRGRRNTPALFNLWWHPHYFADGGIHRLSEVALAPLDNAHELNLPIDTLIRKLRAMESYQTAFRRVFGREPDPFGLTRALMWFQLSLVSANSAFDRWHFEKDEHAISNSAKRGYALFMSERTKCASCHVPPFFADGLFHHTGYVNKTEPDTGRARISMLMSDFGKIKTPSLRNLAFTAPYMHDGALQSIDDVLSYYNKGGDKHPFQDARIQPLGLNAEELDDLKSFLWSLSDSAFIHHPYYQAASIAD